MNNQDLFTIIKNSAIDIFSEDGLKTKLESGKKLKIKMGADPSRPDLHLGHSVVLRKLKLFQELGHEIIFVIGDFTGMIGDPSGRNRTRQPLSFDETRKNGQTYFQQVSKILDKDKTTIIYNSEWLSKMDFATVLQLAGKYTLAQILERDDFAKRYAENAPIGLHELFYPLMQGYDSVALDADIEVGGTDQTFNLLVGRELQRDYGQQPQEVITFPLLIGLDGVEKMSKSLQNYIGIDEPAPIMFEKCMRVPDTLIADYFRLTTDICIEFYTELIKDDIRQAHYVYAREIVSIYHDTNQAIEAEQRYRDVALGKLPDNMPVISIKQPIQLIELMKVIGFASSSSDARRLIEGGGIKIDNQTVHDVKLTLTADEPLIISKGKSQYIKIINNQI